MRQALLHYAAVLVAGMLAACEERREVLYADAVAAHRAGAVDRGWIPKWLPSSARDIREIHSLDTNQSMLAFSFEPADSPKLQSSCKQIQRDELRPVPFLVAWWPGDVPPSAFVTHRHVYYVCEDGAYVALETGLGELFRWRP